jgi:hypothetical protein
MSAVTARNGAVRWLGLVLAGVFAGFLVAVLVLEATLRAFDGSVYTQVRQVELVGLDVLATVTLLPALAATTYLVLADRTIARARRLTVLAALLLVLILVTSVLVNVPINTAQLAWAVPAPPADWAGARDRWQLAHLVRTAAAVAAFGCLSAAALVRPGRNG